MGSEAHSRLPLGAYRHVQELPPGCWLRVRDGAIEVRQYWDVREFDTDHRPEGAILEELEALVRNDRPDWKGALESVKGIYLITDISTGKRYVGSAYGDQGIWSRWCSYVASGHGGNVELRAIATDPNLDYCRKSFRFALLEYRPSPTADDIIIGREDFWKRILLTRGEHGLNRN